MSFTWRVALLITLILCVIHPSPIIAAGVGEEWNLAATAIPTSGYPDKPIAFAGRVWGFPELGHAVSWTKNGADWNAAIDAAPWQARNAYTVAVFQNRMWRLGGVGHNDVWSSPDGTSWTSATAAAAWSARGYHSTVVFAEKLWVLGGLDATGVKNDVWSSADGRNWSCETTSASWSPRQGLASVVHNGKIWVIGGATDGPSSATYSQVWSSTNGTQWKEELHAAPWAARYNLGAVVYDGRIWIHGGSNSSGPLSDVWSSADGVEWRQEVAPGALDYHFMGIPITSIPAQGGAVVFGDSLWLVNGYTWITSTGSTWRQTPGSPPWEYMTGSCTLSFAGKMWVIGGIFSHTIFNQSDPRPQVARNAVWSSSDGSLWTTVTASASWKPRGYHAGLVYKDKMWIFGGTSQTEIDTLSDVWYSSDGVKWTEALTSAPWGNRSGLGAVVHNNRMWVIGGTTMRYSYNSPSQGVIYKNDVWSSTDGVKWDCTATTTPWLQRFDAPLLSFGGRIWLLGGYTGGSTDIWSSPNGADWSRESATVPWSVRTAGVAVIDNRMWALGGSSMRSPSQYGRQVWTSSDGSHWSRLADIPIQGDTALTHQGALWAFDATGSCCSAIPLAVSPQTWDLYR